MNYYSYHIFYFPFKWEIAGEEKKLFSEQVDLKHIPVSSCSMWERVQIDNVQLSQQVDKKEQEELFAKIIALNILFSLNVESNSFNFSFLNVVL